MKEHATAGITLSMKNCFGLTPATIYGTGAGVDEPSIAPKGGRTMVHAGFRQPSKSAPQEKDPKSPRSRRIPGAAHRGRPGRRAPDPPGHRRKPSNHGRRRGSVDSEELTGVAPSVIVAGLNPVDDRCGMHVGDGLRPDGGPRNTAVRDLRQHPAPGRRASGWARAISRRSKCIGTPIAQARFDFASIRKNRRSAPRPPRGIRG